MIVAMEGFLSPTQAALRVGVSPLTLKVWAKQGRIPALQTPNGMVFAVTDVEEAALRRAEKGITNG